MPILPCTNAQCGNLIILREINLSNKSGASESMTILEILKSKSLKKIFQKFRQINYLAISLVKPLLSRNFCNKSVKVKVSLHCALALVNSKKLFSRNF